MASFADLPSDVHTVEIVFADNHGVLRGKRVPATRWNHVKDDGIAVSMAALIWGVRCELRDDCPVGGMETGYPDVTIRPLPQTLRVLPWRPGTVQVLGEVLDPTGTPSTLDPRAALHSVLDEFAGLGYTVKLALEMEFYLLDPATRKPHGTEVNCYAIDDGGFEEEILSVLRNQLLEYGVPIEASNIEYAPGQFEVNLHYQDARDAVDNGVRFRSAVKEIARRHGYLATFMGKPFDDLSGNGMHVHQSLWRDDVNAFRDDSADHGLSETALQYLAGLHAHIRELSLLGSPTANDFKRRQDNTFCPTTVTWGADNRTVAIRTITAGGGTRIEQRDAAADCNPYLAVAGQLAAGLAGIREGLTPPPPCKGDAYAEPTAARLPVGVPEASELLERSALARRAFPKDLLEVYVDTCRYEHRTVTAPVTDVERDRYLGVL
ncbi:glutamine synthetase family protein [Streptomyces sp. NPDC054770]